jgi:hypothetical protein
MPEGTNTMTWPDPWSTLEHGDPDLVAELKRELSPQHVLFGRDVVPIARRKDSDDVLFRLDNGSVAIVHLTWSGKQDQHPKFPWTTIHKTIDDAMRYDSEDYGSTA